jgi:hypothetical protein
MKPFKCILGLHKYTHLQVEDQKLNWRGHKWDGYKVSNACPCGHIKVSYKVGDLTEIENLSLLFSRAEKMGNSTIQQLCNQLKLQGINVQYVTQDGKVIKGQDNTEPQAQIAQQTQKGQQVCGYVT